MRNGFSERGPGNWNSSSRIPRTLILCTPPRIGRHWIEIGQLVLIFLLVVIQPLSSAYAQSTRTRNEWEEEEDWYLPSPIFLHPSFELATEFFSCPLPMLTGDSNRVVATPHDAVDPLYVGPNNGLWGTASNWSPATVPNGIGDTATYDGLAGGGGGKNVRQNTGANVTLGTFSLTGSSAAGFTIIDDNGLTFNQDGAGAGQATISNTNTDTGISNRLAIAIGTGGSITLADDLLISNSGGGRIAIQETITGTGNVTLSNVDTSLTTQTLALVGFASYTGSVLIQKGTATFTGLAGGGSNLLTLGQAGQGSAALVATFASGTFPVISNTIVVAAGTGGTLTLGGIATGGQQRFSGAITLNGNVNARSDSPNGTINNGVYFLNTISGAGSLTKTGTGNLVLSGANTFTGDTILGPGVGELQLNNQNALQNSTLNYTGSTLTFRLDTTSAFTFGGLTGSANIALQVNTQAIPLSVGKNNSSPAAYSGILSGTGSLTKIGTGTLTLTGLNTYTGGTTVSGGTLLAGVGSLVSVSGTIRVNNSGTLLTLSGSGNHIGDNLTISLGGGTYNTNGVSETTGVLTLTSNSFLDLGTGASLANLGSVGTLSGTLSVLDWNGTLVAGNGTDQLLFADGTQALLALSNVFFVDPAGLPSGTYTAVISGLNLNELVPGILTPVPEPSTWVAGALALSVLAWSQRKRFARIVRQTA